MILTRDFLTGPTDVWMLELSTGYLNQVSNENSDFYATFEMIEPQYFVFQGNEQLKYVPFTLPRHQ